MNEVNEALRSHVTRVGFDLSLGKTHVAFLVWLDLLLKANTREPAQAGRDFHRLPRTPAFSNSVVGQHGCIDRGLVVNTAEQRRKPGERLHEMTPRRCWRITPAGRLVINLLKEAGIYQEYAALIPLVTVTAVAS